MKRILLAIIVIAGINIANAQVSFTATISSVGGNCGYEIVNGVSHGSLLIAVTEQALKALSSRTYPDCAACESARQSLKRINDNGCVINISTTPCTPCGGAGNVNILGPSQGSSFFSSTPAEEINDWSNDDIERQLSLNPNFQTKRPDAIVTNDASYNKERTMERGKSGWSVDTDKPFVPVNMREGGSSRIESKDFSIRDKLDQATDFSFLANSANVQRYVKASSSSSLTQSYLNNPQDLIQLLHKEFKTASDFDLDAIMQKLPSERTKDEKQALIDYQEYRKEALEQMVQDIEGIIDNTKEKKEIDAAILALDSYGDDKEGYLSQTNYIKLNMESLPDYINSSLIKVAERIKQFNKTETGFHAEVYYNKVTDTYVVSFRGTELTDLNDLKTDGAIGIDAIFDKNNAIKQYEMAMQIAEEINKIPQRERDNLNIEVVGHSLGGGLASIVGLMTGINAKTFNAAMVPNSFLKEKGLYDKVINGDVQNIAAYHTSTDILTYFQNTINNPAIGISIDIGNPASSTETALAAGTGVAVSAVTPIGTITAAKAGAMVAGHKMPPMVRSIYKSNNAKKKNEWDRLRHLQSSLNKSATYPERQTQDSILIITEE